MAGAAALVAVGLIFLPPAEASKHRREQPANAASAELLGTVGSWSAYASGEKSGRVCYLVSEPQKSDSAGISRNALMAMVTHRPTENISDVVSFIKGYQLKEGIDAVLNVDNRKFELFTRDDAAWARTAELDRTIVTAFIRGRVAVVTGTPQSGKVTSDTYSLIGFTKALGLIDKACDIKR
jgi:hypothetical protein